MSKKDNKQFLPEIWDILQEFDRLWQQLLKDGWSEQNAEVLFDTIHKLGESSEKYALDAINDCALSLEVYLSALIDYDFIQNRKQTGEVVRLLKNLKEAAGYEEDSTELPAQEEWLLSNAVQKQQVYVLQGEQGTFPDWKNTQYTFCTLASVKELRIFLAKNLPQALIIDAGFLSSLEGLHEALKDIRKALAIHLPLFFLLPEYNMKMRLEIMRMGADGHFTLPVSVDTVVKRIQDLVSSQEKSSWRVMIIDDDESQAQFAQRILRKSGMQTLVVNEPLRSLEYLEKFNPDLILMDIYMPDCSGVELTRIIREDAHWLDTPIVILSGEHDPDKQFDALSVGGDDFLAKPISPRHLLSSITTRMQRIAQMSKPVEVMAPGGHLPEKTLPNSKTLGRTEFLQYLDKEDLSGVLVYWAVDNIAELQSRIGIDGMEKLRLLVEEFLHSLLGEEDLLAHFSEYAFFSIVSESLARCQVLLGDILAKISGHLFEVDGRSLTLSLSAGCYVLDGSGNKNRWVQCAQAAFSQAQNEGGNRMQVYEPSVDLRDIKQGDEQVWRETIETALHNNLIKVLFQPIVALHGETAKFYHTVFQLVDKQDEVLNGKEVIPIAKGIGLLDKIEAKMQENVLQIMEQQAAQNIYLLLPHSISALVSADHMENLIEQDREVLQAFIFEFEYDDLLEHLKTSQQYISRLRSLGMHFAVSNLPLEDKNLAQSLQHMDVDFIRQPAGSMKEDMVLNAVMDMAHKQGKKVIVSDVDDAGEMVALWSASVDYIQGHFLQQPAETLDFDFSNSVM